MLHSNMIDFGTVITRMDGMLHSNTIDFGTVITRAMVCYIVIP